MRLVVATTYDVDATAHLGSQPPAKLREFLDLPVLGVPAGKWRDGDMRSGTAIGFRLGKVQECRWRSARYRRDKPDHIHQLIDGMAARTRGAFGPDIIKPAGPLPRPAGSDSPSATGQTRRDRAFHQPLQIKDEIVSFPPQLPQEREESACKIPSRKFNCTLHVRTASQQRRIFRLDNPVDRRPRALFQRVHRRQGVGDISQRTQLDDQDPFHQEGLDRIS